MMGRGGQTLKVRKSRGVCDSKPQSVTHDSGSGRTRRETAGRKQAEQREERGPEAVGRKLGSQVTRTLSQASPPLGEWSGRDRVGQMGFCWVPDQADCDCSLGELG